MREGGAKKVRGRAGSGADLARRRGSWEVCLGVARSAGPTALAGAGAGRSCVCACCVRVLGARERRGGWQKGGARWGAQELRKKEAAAANRIKMWWTEYER